MASFVINEVSGGQFEGFPNVNVRVEAERYEERGSFTVFFDAEDKEVLSVKTSEITNIRNSS